MACDLKELPLLPSRTATLSRQTSRHGPDAAK